MKNSALRAGSAFVVFATVAVSSLFLGAGSASAATDACGAVGTLISPGVCEQVYTTTGLSVFAADLSMTKLEVLIVGGGGAGAQKFGTHSAGGGGDVEVVDFHGTSGNISLVVGGPGADSQAVGGTTNATAPHGTDGDTATSNGGSSGSGNLGTAEGGGGVGSNATLAGGGDGAVVSTLVLGTSLFSTDNDCYGGGGSATTTQSCRAGVSDAAGFGAVDPAANSGGGGGAGSAPVFSAINTGAAGIAIVRWTAAPVTLTFNANGHGTAPAAQPLTAGTAPASPAVPTASGFVFKGWFTDPSLTTAADFSTAISSNTTFYASWVPGLASTGGAPNAAELPIGIAALVLGAALVGFAMYRRSRTP